MNKFYLTVPLVLLLGFSGLYYSHSVESKKEAVAKKAAAEQVAVETAAKKAEAERQAREDAEKRTAERLADEKKKEEEKIAKWAAASQQIAEETASYKEQAAKTAIEVKELEAKLASLRAEKLKATGASFDFAQNIEAARIKKRSAELEIQRLVEMVARKGGATVAPSVVMP